MSTSQAPSNSDNKVSPTKKGRKRKLSVTNTAASPPTGQGSDNEAAPLSPRAIPENSIGNGNGQAVPGPSKKKAKLEPVVPQGKVYGYETEIAQMIYVFGEINEPPLATLHLIEDIVRGQVVELLSRARQTSHLRLSRHLAIEDLIFLIRDDRVKVNRLRTYLSWKEVRKNAKKEGDNVGAGLEIGEEEVGDDKKAVKKQVVKLPWEILTPFNDLLRNLPSKLGGGAGGQDDEDEDDDELEAYEDNIQRLREHDVVTRKMTKEQYVFYSECRQASFTFRKAKRFRDFVNATTYLDVKPNDDINDILGFLCFEMVRTICIAALASRNRSMGIIKPGHLEKAVEPEDEGGTSGNTAEVEGGEAAQEDGDGQVGETPKDGDEEGDEDILEELKDDEEEEDIPKKKKRKATGKGGKGKGEGGILGAPPNIPCDEYSLLPSHVLTAFTRMQRDQAMERHGGIRGWRGGPTRMKIGLI